MVFRLSFKKKFITKKELKSQPQPHSKTIHYYQLAIACEPCFGFVVKFITQIKCVAFNQNVEKTGLKALSIKQQELEARQTVKPNQYEANPLCFLNKTNLPLKWSNNLECAFPVVEY